MEAVLLILSFLVAFVLAAAVDTFLVWLAFVFIHDGIPSVPELSVVHAFYVGCALSLVGMVFKGLRD